MSENNSNSLNKDDQGNGNEFDSKYEKISSYVDREFDDSILESEITELISSDIDYHNRYQIELAVKKELRKRIKPVEVPAGLLTKINADIGNYSKLHSNSNPNVQKVLDRTDNLLQENKQQAYSTNLQQKKYFYIFSGTFAVLLIAFLIINFYNQPGNSPVSSDDMIAMSHNIYHQIEKGEIELQYVTDNPRELEQKLSNGCNFKVFIPDVKDAVLIGGVYNEINGVPVAHFIHKKGNTLIYTFQTKMKDISDRPDQANKLYLISDVKDKLNKGENWFPCEQSHHGDNAAIWYIDEVVCSSVSKMDFNQIHATLTDFR